MGSKTRCQKIASFLQLTGRNEAGIWFGMIPLNPSGTLAILGVNCVRASSSVG